MRHGFIDSLRKSASEWKAIPENLRSGEKRKRIPAIFGVVGSAVLACVGIELGVGIAADIDESMKNQAAAVQEGLNRPSCTTEVTDKQQTPEHEIIIPAGQTYTTIEVPESQTVTMTLGEGCRPGTPGREVKVGVRDDLWEKVKPGDMLYHPGGSTDWDVYDNYPVSMDDSTGSKESNPMDNNGDDVIVRDLPTVGTGQVSPAVAQEKYSEPAASEFHISPQALEEIASN